MHRGRLVIWMPVLAESSSLPSIPTALERLWRYIAPSVHSSVWAGPTVLPLLNVARNHVDEWGQQTRKASLSAFCKDYLFIG